jgi:protein-tyrosine phosphatase
MDEIIPALWISDAQSVRNLEPPHRFDEVVTLGYLDILGYERPEESTTGDSYVFVDGPHEYEVFEAAVNYTLNALRDEQTVLVHCQAGVSRSAGVCGTTLAIWDSIPIETALQQVEDARPRIDPAPPIRASMQRFVDERVAEQ